MILRQRLWLGLLAINLALFVGADAQARGSRLSDTASPISVVDAGDLAGVGSVDLNLDKLLPAFNKYNSDFRGVTTNPDGSSTFGFSQPVNSSDADRLGNRLDRNKSVRFYEVNHCREFLSELFTGNAIKSLVTPASPSINDFLAGESLEWDPAALVSTSLDDGAIEYSVQDALTRAVGESAWDVFEVDQCITRYTETTTHPATITGPTITHGPSTTTSAPPIGPTRTRTKPPIESTAPPIPHEYDTDSLACSKPSILAEAGPAPKVQVKSGPAGDFPYPRPIPLQAIARDYDILQIGCDGCGGDPSNLRRPIEDGIQSYKWSLQKLGSLNDPFFATEDLDELLKKIEELKKKIEKTAQDLKEKQDEKVALDATRDQRRGDIDEEIGVLREQKAKLEQDKAQLSEQISMTEQQLQQQQQALDEAQQKITDLEQQLTEKQTQVDELQDKINGEPSPEEQQLAAQLDVLEQRLKAKYQQLAQRKQTNQQQADALQQTYDQAQVTLDTARQALANIQVKVQARQNQITGLENSLYSNPLLRDFFNQRGQLSRLGVELKSYYFSNMDLPVSPTNILSSLGQQLLQAVGGLQKQDLLDQFVTEKSRLLNDLAGRCASLGSDASACQGGVDELADQLDQMEETLNNALSQPNVIDPQKWQQLKTAKQALQNLNAQATQAQQQVQTAQQNVDQAQLAYINGLNDLEQSEADLVEEIRTLEEESAEVASKLRQAQLDAEREREEMTPQWLEDIAQLRSAMEDIWRQINQQRSSTQTHQIHIYELQTTLAQQRAERESLDSQIQLIQRKIDKKQQEKTDLDGESGRLQGEIDDLKAELDRLKKELEDLEARKSSLLFGTKQATGQQVYYVPPPLEQILKDQAGFERLKKDVGKKRGELAETIGAKAALQQRAYKILKGMNQQLWIVKASLAAIESLSTEIEGLDFARRDQETSLTLEQNEKLGKEQQKKTELDQEKQQTDAKADQAKQDEERENSDVEDAKAQVETLEQEQATAEDDVFAKIEQLRIQRQMRARKTEVLAGKRVTHEQTVAKLKAQEAEIGRINDAITRAVATDNQTGAANLREAQQAAQRERQTIETQSTTEQTELQALAGDLRLATVAEKTASDEEKEAQQTLFRLQRELRHARQNLRKQTEELDEFKEKRLTAEKDAREAEDAVNAQQEKIKKTKEDIDKGVAENDGVKSTQAEIDKKTAAKAQAEAAKNKAKNTLTKLIEDRDKWKKDSDEADDNIKAKRKALESAEAALEAFLKKEFKQASFSVTLQLEVEDAKIDKWRAKEDAVVKTITINYSNRRPEVIHNDDIIAKPLGTHKPALCDVELGFDADAPIAQVNPTQTRNEPQTIALYYKQGQPLYDVWAPRNPTLDTLSSSAAEWVAGGSDSDKFTTQCKVGGGTVLAVPGGMGSSSSSETFQIEQRVCKDGEPSTADIADVVHSNWKGATAYTSPAENIHFIKVPVVPKDKCSAKMDMEVTYSDSGLQADDGDKKKTPDIIFPGVIGDLSKDVTDFDDMNKAELVIQLFDGAHQGLSGEEIEWKVNSSAPDDKYGFESDKKKQLTEKTDGSGYSKVDFYFEQRYGKASVEVKWKRGDQDCKVKTIKIARLLQLQLLEVGNAPKDGWGRAEKLFTGGTSDVEALAKEQPDASADKAPTIATGLLDDRKTPVDEKSIEFSVEKPDGVKMQPEKMQTKIAGLAWSYAKDPPEEVELLLKAKVEAELEEYTKPAEVEGEQSTKTANQFLIGRDGKYLTVETEEPFVPGGDPYTGGAKLIIDGSSVGIPVEFNTLDLSANGIETQAQGDGIPIASGGSVNWPAQENAGGILNFTKAGFTMKLTQLGLTAGADGQMKGKVKVPKAEEEAEFSATIGPGGFLGEIANFPEVELAKMKLEKGANVVVDMHADEDPEPQPEGWTGQGLLIRQGKVILPEALKGKSDSPPAIAFKDMFINAAGLNGNIAVEYTITAGMGDMQFAINKVDLTFAQSVPTGGTLEGGITFPDPFVGEVQGKLTIQSGGSYAVEFSTDKTVAAPKLGLAFNLQKASGSYDQTKDLYSFELSAILKSEKFSDISIKGFKFNSNGEIEAEQISIDKDIEFGKGFEIHLNTFGFKRTAEEYSLSLDSKFQFGEILTAEQVAITIVTGPRIEEFDLKIEGQRKPVTFKTEIHYKADLLEGSVDVDVEKLFKINGTFVMGAKGQESDDPWTFWYVELNSRVAIPLGQTGLNIIELGGGVGYNYDPPIGVSAGAPRKTDAFAFKAAVAIGNVPRGEVFAGRTSLVLVTDHFTINGKVWLLTKEDSLFGEGQLSLHWAPSSKLDGYVRMGIGLPDASGKLLRFNGQVDFLYAGSNDWTVKSRTLEGSILERINAEGTIDVKPGKAHLDGKVYYDLYKEVDYSVATLKVQLNLNANASLDFVTTETSASLNGQASFRGHWDVNLETPVKEFDIVSGTITAQLQLIANNHQVSVSGNIRVSWETWVHSGSTNVDVGYSG